MEIPWVQWEYNLENKGFITLKMWNTGSWGKYNPRDNTTHKMTGLQS